MRSVMMQRWRRLAGDERGTSLTEFVITMPIFIMIMSFVYYMGVAGHVMSQETGEAQRILWDGVMEQNQDQEGPVNHPDPMAPHIHPSSAAEVDEEFLTAYELRQKRPDLLMELRTEEEEQFEALAAGGHWGESHRRTRRAHEVVRFSNGSDNIVDDPTAVVGGSQYALGLVDDRGTAPITQIGVGASGALNEIAAEGPESESLIPVLGAGIRYGVMHGIQEGEIEFPHGWSLPVRLHFDVLVPPVPMESERRTAAVTRMQLEEHGPYQELLGVQTAQDLPGGGSPAAPSWP